MTERELLKENLRQQVASKIALEHCIEVTMEKLYSKKSVFTYDDKLEMEKAFIIQQRKRLKARLEEINGGLPF